MSSEKIDGLDQEWQIDSKMTSPSDINQDITSNGKTVQQVSANHKMSKMMSVEVHFLDDSVNSFQIQYKALGRVLFDEVCKMLNLLEVDYFGLEYTDDRGTKHWLDYEKMMCRQTGLSSSNSTMYFLVKFFTPDPAQLEEEYTRYLFSLQIKKNLADGTLQCNDNSAALMASYIVQAECGDYAPEDYPDHTYLSCYKFVPHQDSELQKKIMENHKKHIGQSPAEADLNLLETARRCELYGIQMTPARDHEGVVLNLAVAHMGILVFQNFTKINTFSWAKIRKLSFKRKRFLIKLLPEGYGYYKDTVEFFFEHRNESKNFWKKCIENHAFFRCAEVKRIPRQKPRIFSRGSSFRYSGRTQKQIVEYVRENYVQRRTFQRSISLRATGTTDDDELKAGNTTSAQPLLPISTSQSYGSVALPKSEECNETKSKPLSHSEPPSPFSISDGILGSANGNHDKNSENQLEHESSHQESPELDEDGGGFRSPDYLGQDTDDNISHDSYHLEEKEAVSVEKSPCKTPGSEIYYSEADHQDDSTDNSVRDFISDENSHFLTSSFGSFHSESSALTLHYLHSLHGSFKKSLVLNKPFHIAKELLMTERTYKKDLEIVNVWFREEVSREKNLPKDVLELLLSLIDGLYEIHCYLLRHLEEFVLVWEGKGRPMQTTRMTGIGEILEQNIGMTETYNKYINTLPMILEKLHHSYCCNEYFEQMYRCFEMQRICYLPLISFILRPVHRLLQYYLILKKIMKHYEQSHPDYGSCKETLLQLKQILSSQDLSIKYLENYANLMELQRDIVGINNLVKPDREFVRCGSLQKYSRKGFQHHMFFLFSDMLLYTVRVASPSLEFKVKKQVSLQDVVIEKTEPKYGANFCFILYTDAKTFLLAANSEEERNRWLIDMKEATQRKKKSTILYHNTSESEDYLHKLCIPDSEQDHSQENSNIIKHQHSSNSLLHVCWHRNTSVNYEDCRHSLLNYFSGPLLRKFKNSSGWQRLWVVFAQFSLFFYKSYQDDFPLANLPVLHYNISIPTEKDDINRPYCFKLEYKRHVYYFCAESEHMLQRWIEVIGSATAQRELLNCICMDIEEDF